MHRTDPRTEAHSRRSQRLVPLIVSLAVSVGLLAACGTPVAPHLPTLACEVEGYPCTYAEVPLAVIERSLTVADEAGALFEGGATVEEVLDLLTSQPDLATAAASEGAVEFRLTGGLPIVIDPDIDVPLLPYQNTREDAPALRGGTTAPWLGGSYAPSGAPQAHLVVGTPAARSALVLAPFAFDYDGWDSGAQAAAVLNATPSYEGRVTFHQTTDPDQPVVTVADLLDLEAYDVVYLSTHGGRLCIDEKDTGEVKATGVDDTTEDCRSDFLIQRFTGTAADLKALEQPGIVLYRGTKHVSIGVTGDFFRSVYPDGLPDTLFVLVSCNTFTPDFYGTIPGARGVFVSWDGNVYSDTALAALKMVQVMADKGWTVTETMDSLASVLVDQNTGAIMRSSDRRAGGDLRLRDLVSVEDVYTSNQFPNAYEIGVTGAPDDSEPDEFALDITVDGVTVDSLSGFVLNVAINGDVRFNTTLDSLGNLLDDHTWNAIVDVPLGFDAMEGEEVEVDVWVDLPEGGTSRVTASPMVVGSPSELGTVWDGELRYEHARNAGDWTMIITANVTFEREQGVDSTARYQSFLLTGGAYTVELQGLDALGCTVSGTMAGSMAEEPYTALTFDTSTSPIVVKGWGHSKTPLLMANVVCPNGDTGTQQIDTNKVLLNIPESIAATVSNSTAVGDYVVANSDTTQTWNWNLARVD